MEISSLVNVSNKLDPQTGVAGGELGKNQFLKMLIVQMQNQDPTNPVDNAELTAQLAQFSSLEQMENLNSKFENFQQNATAAMSIMNAGKPVFLELADGTSVNGLLEKVQWNDGETQFVIDGISYPASKVKSLTAAPEAPSNNEDTTVA